MIFLEHQLGCAVQTLKMVLPGLHPVPDLIIRKARHVGGRCGALFHLRAIGAVQCHEGIRKGRRGPHQSAQFSRGMAIGAKKRVCQILAQLRLAPRIFAIREIRFGHVQRNNQPFQ